MSRRLLVVCNDLDFFLLHRLPETTGALRASYEVHVATPPGKRVAEVESLGFVHHPLALSRSGRNPLCELVSFIGFCRLYRQVRPDLVYLMTIKPILYGGMAARLTGVKAVVAAVFGLGYVFTDEKLTTRLLRKAVSFVYGLALGKRNLRTIFQNPTDRDVLVGLGAVSQEKTVVIRGSGVDLKKFKMQPEPAGVISVLMAARLLRDKGVSEFVEAARQLKSEGINARFWLAGSLDVGNPSSFVHADLEKWHQEGNVELLGFHSDMPLLLPQAHIVVLPSYREGLPRVLEEAAACGRAVVTTDVPGCRDAIIPGETGLLVPVRNAGKLAEAIRLLVENAILRRHMGESGRKLAERCYAVEMIVQAHLSLYQELLGPDR